MTKIYKLLTAACVLFCSAVIAQPVLGTTDFAVNGTISWNTNSPCVATKTADVQGWLVSVSSTSNCGINQSNSGSFSDSDGRLQYLVGFGTLSQASFGSDDGSEFALQRLTWSCSTYSFASASIQFIGYRNGSPVPGATLTAITPTASWGTTSNKTVVTFTNNLNFINVDNVIMVPTGTCSSILAFEDISIGSPTVCSVNPTVTLTGSTNNLCNGGSAGGATVSASGAGPFSYSWSPSGGTASYVAGRTSGIYTVVVTNSCTLSSALTVTISQPSALVTSTAVTHVACNGGSNGVASITASGGTGSYTYLWSSGNTTSAITGKMAGAYTATVTDANNCTSIKTAIITQPSALVTSTAVTHVACNGGSNGVASITASGGAGGYSYLWNTGNTTSAITGKMAGAYTATVTDANSCTSIKSAVITQPTSLVTSTAVTNVACNGGSNGVASITASGGAGSYTYLWSNGATTSTITGLLAGAYSATVTDANSCTSLKSATITHPTALATTTAVTNISCNGGNTGSATLTTSGGVGGYTYLWSNSATSATVSALLAGAYSATVTDANNCTSIKSLLVTQPSALITTTSVTNPACNGGTGSATITASGGTGTYTYLWSSGATTSLVSGFLAGSYTATVTDANTCTSTKTVVLTQPSSLSLTASAPSPTLCSGSTTTLTANGNGGTGAINYTWTSGPSATIYVVSPLVTTVYTVSASDINNCLVSTTLGINAAGLPTITVNNPTTCAGSSATLLPTGANTYTISGGSTIVSPVNTSTYSVTGTGSNGCASSNTAISTVVVNTLSPLSINSGAICPGNSFTLSPSGVNTYTLTDGTFTISGGNFTVSPTITTNYSITGTDANGCNASNTAVSTVSVKTTPTVSVNSASICAGSSVVITPTGAATYTISGGTFTVSPLTTTIYSVTGTSTNGCISAEEVSSVTVYGLPSITVNSGVICAGESFTMMPSGAATYTFSNGSNVVINPSLTATYSITGTSNEGCAASNTAVATVSVVNTLTINISGNTTICAGETATLTANGANTYSWSAGDQTSTVEFTPSSTTDYTVTGFIGTCSNTAIVSVSVNPLPTVIVNSGQTCKGTSFVLQPTGANAYSITGNTFTVTPTTTQSYTVTGTDLNGCVSAEVVSTVTVNALPVVTVSSSNTLVCVTETSSITGTGAVTYSWSTHQTDMEITITPTITGTETYTVWGTDVNGCVGTATFVQVADACVSLNRVDGLLPVVRVYPNPTHGLFMIEAAVNTTITITNILGQSVFTETTTNATTEISIHHLSNGVYFVRMYENGSQKIVKVVKD